MLSFRVKGSEFPMNHLKSPSFCPVHSISPRRPEHSPLWLEAESPPPIELQAINDSLGFDPIDIIERSIFDFDRLAAGDQVEPPRGMPHPTRNRGVEAV